MRSYIRSFVFSTDPLSFFLYDDCLPLQCVCSVFSWGRNAILCQKNSLIHTPVCMCSLFVGCRIKDLYTELYTVQRVKCLCIFLSSCVLDTYTSLLSWFVSWFGIARSFWAFPHICIPGLNNFVLCLLPKTSTDER